MRGVKKLYYWCVLFTGLLFLLIQLYFYLNPTTIEEDNKLILSKIREREIKSIVKRKSIDSYKRRAIFVIYDKDSIPINGEWKEKINVGDSIIKSKGSLELIIKNNIGMDTLNYIEIVNNIPTIEF